MNVRQYNGVNRAIKWINRAVKWLNRAVKWIYWSVYPIVLSDIHFTAFLTSLYCLTFTLLLYLPHFIVWYSFYYSVYSFYCSVYPIVLSDIHFTALFNHFTALFIHFIALFTPLYCLTFILLLCLLYCDNTMG
jgi:hypothetical protein